MSDLTTPQSDSVSLRRQQAYEELERRGLIKTDRQKQAVAELLRRGLLHAPAKAPAAAVKPVDVKQASRAVVGGMRGPVKAQWGQGPDLHALMSAMTGGFGAGKPTPEKPAKPTAMTRPHVKVGE